MQLRAGVAETLTNDPVALALIVALGLGSLAALLFAAIGFLVTLVVAISERLDEIAVLRAVGASRRDVSRWLGVDSGVLLGFGLIGGLLLGLVLALLILPFAAMTQTGQAPVPAPRVVIPVELLPLGLAVAVGLALAAIVVIRVQLRTERIAQVLRDVGG